MKVGLRAGAYRAVIFMFLVLVATDTLALTGTVVKVADGDTITILTNEKRQVRVRLANIDAPEKGQAWGERSRKALADRVGGRSVEIQSSGSDRYGRVVATVLSQGRNINLELVSSGNAWAYRAYLTDKKYLDVELEARHQKVGLWGLPEAEIIPPWDFRKHERAKRGSK